VPIPSNQEPYRTALSLQSICQNTEAICILDAQAMPVIIQEEEMEVEEMNKSALEQAAAQDIVTAARWCLAATASLKLQKIRTLKGPT
jgi:hypothetical protein